jgi:hypothetical protein
MVFAHVGGVPVEELLLPAVWSAATLGLAVRTCVAPVRRRLARVLRRSGA